MKPRDIIMFRDNEFGHHRFWEVQGVFLRRIRKRWLIGEAR